MFKQLKTHTESLDKFQSSVKSAADAYTTLLSGNHSSTELLDSIQAINQAVTDMDESIAWEEIDSLDLLCDKLEEVSRKYAESILSDAGINVNSDFGKVLTDIISQMYEAEAKFTGMNAQLDRLQSSYQTLTSILESYNETGYICLDNLQSLLTADENLISMLEVENGQLVINQAAYENLVAAQLLEFKEKLNNAAASEIEALALNKAEEATNNNAKASEDAVEKLDSETAAFNRNTSAAIANNVAKAEIAGVSEQEIQDVLDKYNEIWNAAINNYKGDFSGFMGVTEKAGKDAGQSAGEEFTEALDKELAALDKKMEAGYIDFKDYIQARLALIEDYYRQGKIKADEYYSYLEKHYDQELSYRDKVIKAVTRRLDKEIDGLKNQKDAIEDSYKLQIESLEKQKSLLEEANKERQKQIDLQKSLYELERARNQRTKLIYSEDKGMHYVADEKSIRDAQQDVDSVRYDIQISEIEKSISKLEEARDNQTGAIDEMISKLEEYKDAWNDITSAYEDAQEDLIASQILGSNWETDILNGRLDVLDAFKNQYIAIQQAMADAAWQSANEQIKAAKEAEKGSSGSVAHAPKIESDTSSISKVTGGGYDYGSLALSNSLDKHIYNNKAFRAYKSGTTGISHDEKNALVSEYGQTEITVLPNGNAIITDRPTLMDLPKDTVIYNEEETNKIIDNKVNVSGKAYADGTRHAEKGLAVVGEEKPEVVITNNKKVLLAEHPTLLNMEGGETVFDGDETEKLLKARGLRRLTSDESPLLKALTQYSPSEIQQRLSSNMINPVKSISSSAIQNASQAVNVNNNASYTMGDVHVHCPGITKDEVAKQIGTEMTNIFSGLSLKAYQRANITR